MIGIGQLGLRRPGFLSLRLQVLIGFTLVFTLVFALLFGWAYWYSSRETLASIRTELLNTIYGGTLGIDGDRFAELAASPGVPQSGRVRQLYLQHQNWLRQIHQIEPHADPYTFVSAGSGKKVRLIGDVFSITHPERTTAFGETLDASRLKLYGGLSGLTVNMQPHEDLWGTRVLASAYHPLRDRTGRVVGALAIDFSVEHLWEVQAQIRDLMAEVFALTYSALFLLVYLLSARLTRPLIHLTQAVQGVAEGRYDGFAPIARERPGDEIGILSQAFGSMVEQVRQREHVLQRTVQELRIEIDEGKKASQVKEIVDSDLFRDLKLKARAMRERARSDSLSAEHPATAPQR